MTTLFLVQPTSHQRSNLGVGCRYSELLMVQTREFLTQLENNGLALVGSELRTCGARIGSRDVDGEQCCPETPPKSPDGKQSEFLSMERAREQ